MPRGAKGASGVSPLVRSMPGGVLAYQTSLLYLVRNCSCMRRAVACCSLPWSIGRERESGAVAYQLIY